MNPSLSLEIPIDPALLLEEEHHATDNDNDLEDAEGELVDQPMDDDYAQEEFDVIHVSPGVLMSTLLWSCAGAGAKAGEMCVGSRR